MLIFAHSSATELLVPALLRDLDKKEIKVRKSARSSAATPSFTIVFPDGGPRRGIYCSLLCWLVSDEENSPASWSILTNQFGVPTCLHRNCVQFKLHKSPAMVTLIDTYTHFEIHINVPINICPEIIPMVCQTIFKGLGKVALNLNYDGSSPSPALVCPCGRGDAHVATANTELGYWTCTQNVTWYGKLTPLQFLWLDNGSNASDKKLTFGALSESHHLSKLLCQLNPHASKWREIGTHLGFRQGELDNIEHKPLLLNEGPKAWLREMLREWLEWAPGDSRGSSSFASIECLKCALDNSGLGKTALEVESCLIQTIASEHAPPTKRPRLDPLASNPVT